MTDRSKVAMLRSSRRNFLQLAAGAALTTSPWIIGCATDPQKVFPNASPNASPNAWAELAAMLPGGVLRSVDSTFQTLAAPRNLRYSNVASPVGIARCKSAGDVQTCLQWAQAYRLPLVARSGGHSYAGYSLTPGLMIELAQMDSLVFDAASGKAVVGGGARNLTLYGQMPAVKTAVTHGMCASVGVGGLVLGGGVGLNMREHGLLIDQLVETEVITAAGRRLRCNEKENADLYWACRGGGGGNFGIHTSFTFQTFPVDKVTAFNFEWRQSLDELLPAALDLLLTMPEKFGCVLVVEVDAKGGLLLDLTGQFKGDAAQLSRLIAPLSRVAKPHVETIKTLDYWDAQRTVLGENSSPAHFHERSRYADRPLTAAASRRVLAELRRWPRTSVRASWKMFLMGGAINRVAPLATAYVHRSALMLTAIELNWDERDTGLTLDRNQAWLDNFHMAMAEHTSDRCYQNFIDDSQPNFLQAYYGENLARLVQVKRAVDPTNVFNYRQGIPLSL